MSEKSIYDQEVVIVGGGAGGLELATRLGRKYARKGLKVTLVDKNSTHIWKPLLHEVATGSLDAGIDEVSYPAQARSAGFRFQIGEMEALDRDKREIQLAAVKSADGELLLQPRTLHYDYLVMALGSVSNDFGTKGAADNCFFLDDRDQADRFHKQLLNTSLHVGAESDRKLKVGIVGGGATGVELSAELFNAAKELQHYGMAQLDKERLAVTLVEAGPTLLPALPPRISGAVRSELRKLGVDVRENTKISAVKEGALVTSEGEEIEADLIVWAAGIKAPVFLKEIGGLETNNRNQLVVGSDMRSTRDERIFAMGDCAACPLLDGKGFVPPRAQAAHQMASHLYKHFGKLLEGKEIPPYKYQDHGSLVSLSRYSTVGNLMGNLTKGSLMIEGRIARIVYVSLYRMHQIALFGYLKTMLVALVDRINKVIRPRLKLH